MGWALSIALCAGALASCTGTSFHGCDERAYWSTDHCVAIPAGGVASWQGPLKRLTNHEVCVGFGGGGLTKDPARVNTCFRLAQKLSRDNLLGKHVSLTFDSRGRVIALSEADGQHQ